MSSQISKLELRELASALGLATSEASTARQIYARCLERARKLALSAKGGLHWASAADKAVLEACAASVVVTDGCNGRPMFVGSTHDIARAEFFRRALRETNHDLSPKRETEEEGNTP
jgi:hypothetical protein